MPILDIDIFDEQLKIDQVQPVIDGLLKFAHAIIQRERSNSSGTRGSRHDAVPLYYVRQPASPTDPSAPPDDIFPLAATIATAVHTSGSREGGGYRFRVASMMKTLGQRKCAAYRLEDDAKQAMRGDFKPALEGELVLARPGTVLRPLTMYLQCQI